MKKKQQKNDDTSLVGDAIKLLKGIENSGERFMRTTDRMIHEIEAGFKVWEKEISVLNKDIARIETRGADDLDQALIDFLSEE